MAADDIHADSERLLAVLGGAWRITTSQLGARLVFALPSDGAERQITAGHRALTNHVHARDPGLVQLVNDLLGGHADSADEKGGLLVDDDVDQLGKGAVRVVLVGLASAAADLCAGEKGKGGQREVRRTAPGPRWRCWGGVKAKE